jgi:hypothetical protein
VQAESGDHIQFESACPCSTEQVAERLNEFTEVTWRPSRFPSQEDEDRQIARQKELQRSMQLLRKQFLHGGEGLAAAVARGDHTAAIAGTSTASELALHALQQPPAAIDCVGSMHGEAQVAAKTSVSASVVGGQSFPVEDGRSDHRMRKFLPWTAEDDCLLMRLVEGSGIAHWETWAKEYFSGRTGNAISHRYRRLQRLKAQAAQSCSTAAAAAGVNLVRMNPNDLITNLELTRKLDSIRVCYFLSEGAEDQTELELQLEPTVATRTVVGSETPISATCIHSSHNEIFVSLRCCE